jgi:hypothetical protein
MAVQDERYRQAAWTYVAYGVVYWLGGLALAQSGLGPRGMERGRWAWFIIGALFVLMFPWLLMRVWRWRRGFAGLLAVLVAYRALEVARIAWRSSGRPSRSLASPCPCRSARGPSVFSRSSPR